MGADYKCNLLFEVVLLIFSCCDIFCTFIERSFEADDVFFGSRADLTVFRLRVVATFRKVCLLVLDEGTLMASLVSKGLLML